MSAGPFRVALTGTPGTGKTAVARELVRGGWAVLDVAEYATTEGFVVEEDVERGSLVLDEEAIAEALAAETTWPDGPIVLDGHVAHLLPVEATVVLRCDPIVLYERLRGRGWSEPKVRENVEAEALSVIAEEAEGERVAEIDTTRREPLDVAREVHALATKGFPPRKRIGWDASALPWL